MMAGPPPLLELEMVPRSPCPPLSKESWLNQNLRPKEEGEASRVLSSVPVGHVMLRLWATPVAGAKLPGAFLWFDSSVC